MGRQAFRLGTLIALTFLLAVPARAGVERWTPYGPPDGHLVTLAISDGRLLAATEESGVYASADRGLTWFWSGTGTFNERIEALVVDPDDSEIYAAGQRRFFRSTDRGAHWTVLGSLPAQSQPVDDVLALAPGEPDVFFLAIGRILYRSTDGGRTWGQVLAEPFDILSVLVDPNDPSSVFVGAPGALLHSGDGGATWAPVTNVLPSPDLPPTPTPFIYGIREITAVDTNPTTFFVVAGRALYRSTDAGASWMEVAVPGPVPGYNPFIESVVATPGPQPRIYTLHLGSDAFRRNLYVSEDLGDTWTLVSDRARGISLRVDPVTGDLASFDVGDVGLPEDEGATWRLSPLGNQSCGLSSFPRPTAKVRFAPGRTYTVVGGRLWESRDGGVRWSVLGRDLIDQCFTILDVAVDPRPGVLWAASSSAVYRSNDGGTTWTRSLGPVPIGDGALRFQGVTVLDSRTILFSGFGIWRSGDRGATWKQTLSGRVLHDEFNEPLFMRAVYRVRVDPENPQIVYAGVFERGERHPPETLPYVYQSLDGGRTWRRIVERGYVLAIDPRQPKTLYTSSQGDLLRSRDRGRHWRQVGELDLGANFAFIPAGSDLQVDPRDPRVLWAASGDGPEHGVFRSPDGGATWEPLKAGMDGLPAFEIFPDPRQPGRFFVASEGLFVGRFALPGD